jgi:hypothetical protein
MSAVCEQVERRRAAAEALDEALDEAQTVHAAGCPRCVAGAAAAARVARVLAERGARAGQGGDAAFVARVSAGAAARLEQRARAARRWPAFAGAAVACAALAVALGVRARQAPSPSPSLRSQPGALLAQRPSEPFEGPAPAALDDAKLVAGLAELADVERGLARGGHWDSTLAPVAAAGELAPGAVAPLGSKRVHPKPRSR